MELRISTVLDPKPRSKYILYVGIFWMFILLGVYGCKPKSEKNQLEKIREIETMPSIDAVNFYNTQGAPNFFQLNFQDANYIVSLDMNDDTGISKLILFKLEGNGVHKIKEADGPNINVKKIDGYIFDDVLLICTQVNDWEALKWFTQDASKFLTAQQDDGGQVKDEFMELSVGMNLGQPWFDISKINLPVSLFWNVSTPLSPSSWLFSPKFILQDNTRRVIVNTADGNMARLQPPNGNIPNTELLTVSGFRPEAVIYKEETLLSYLVYSEVAYPYNGFAKNEFGDLYIKEGKISVNLSTSLGVGGVIAHTMSLSKNGNPWLFVLKEVAVGTELIAIERSTSGDWTIREKTTVSIDASDINAQRASDKWLIVLSEEKNIGSSLWYLLWNI